MAGKRGNTGMHGNHSRKVTDEQAREIQESAGSVKELAWQYSVSDRQIYRIKQGRRW